jgi:hypothetical protein
MSAPVRGGQCVERAAGLAAVARDFGGAFLVAVELFQHDHRQEDVVLFEAEQAHRIVQQHVRVEHEQLGRTVGLALGARGGCLRRRGGSRHGRGGNDGGRRLDLRLDLHHGLRLRRAHHRPGRGFRLGAARRARGVAAAGAFGAEAVEQFQRLRAAFGTFVGPLVAGAARTPVRRTGRRVKRVRREQCSAFRGGGRQWHVSDRSQEVGTRKRKSRLKT